jgi:hypothetical protein
VGHGDDNHGAVRIEHGAKLEADWRRAWDDRARVAECGDYTAAEHWHHRAQALGARLALADRAAEARRLPAVHTG